MLGIRSNTTKLLRMRKTKSCLTFVCFAITEEEEACETLNKPLDGNTLSNFGDTFFAKWQTVVETVDSA